MINIIIGSSGSGKTTFVKKTFITETCENFKEEEIKLCRSGKNLLFGHYNIEKRTEGTDTMSYSIIEKIIKKLKELIGENKYGEIVLEGDRINNLKFFKSLEQFKEDIKVYLFDCSIDTSLKRLRKADSKIGLSFLKMTKTKSLNNFELAKRLGFKTEKINTDDKKWW